VQHRDHGPTGRSEITGDGQHELLVAYVQVGRWFVAQTASSSARRTARSTVETRYDETDEPDDAAQGNRCTGTECRQDDHRQPDPFRMEAEVTRFPLAQDERVERLGKGRYRHDAGQQER